MPSTHPSRPFHLCWHRSCASFPWCADRWHSRRLRTTPCHQRMRSRSGVPPQRVTPPELGIAVSCSCNVPPVVEQTKLTSSPNSEAISSPPPDRKSTRLNSSHLVISY